MSLARQHRLMDRKVPPYVAVVLDQPAMGQDWRKWVTAGMAESHVLLEPDETFCDRYNENELLGWYDFLEAEEAEWVLQAIRVEMSVKECPWVAPLRVRGALGWFPLGTRVLKYNFVPRLVTLCRGPVICTMDGSYHELVRKVTFSLGDLVRKRGFDEGDAFLDRSAESEYMRYCRQQVEAALENAGLEALVSVDDEARPHNPMRICGPILYKNRKFFRKASEWVLDDLSVELWAYNWKCCDDRSFWL